MLRKAAVLNLCLFQKLQCVCRAAYRAVLLVYGLVFCGGFIPMMLWLMPNEPFDVGEVRLRRLHVLSHQLHACSNLADKVHICKTLLSCA